MICTRCGSDVRLQTDHLELVDTDEGPKYMFLCSDEVIPVPSDVSENIQYNIRSIMTATLVFPNPLCEDDGVPLNYRPS